MYAYHRLWLILLVLAIVTSSMCGFANEHDVSENDNLMPESHIGASQSASSLRDLNASVLNKDMFLELHSSLRFEPPHLDFGSWSVGTVRSHTVTLINQNRNRSVYLNSVSCETPAFSSSFFETSMIPPNGNTTFNVIFLPREQGAISTSLQIQTSFGKLQLLVHGEGQECPYKLKPLVGIRAPLNATLMPEIHMYNPHQNALQVLEIYSSGGHFQLELPSDDNEAPKGLWEIPPFTTKPVIRIRFQGYTAGNYSAFIRIKIAEPSRNTSDTNGKNEEQILVIPVEFEILPKYGVYAVNPILEFGQIAVDVTEMKVFRQKLFLKHSKTQLEMKDLKFEEMTYLTGLYYDQNNTNLELKPNKMNDSVVHLNDKLKLVLRDKTAYTYHIDLRIRADIFKGILQYNANKTLFLIDAHEKSSNRLQTVDEDEINKAANSTLDHRLVRLCNNFKIPMIIYNITNTVSDSIKLSLQMPSFEMGMILQPRQTIDLYVSATLVKEAEHQQESKQDLKDLRNYKTVIYVFTNITNFEIPIVISTARLFITTQTQTLWRYNTSVYTKELNLGSIQLRERSKNGFILLQNRNSIPLKLGNFGIDNPQGIYYHISHLGCLQANELKENKSNAIDLNKANYKFTTQLEEGDVAVFVANINPYSTDYDTAHFKISTKYENVTVDIKFSTALGKLEVDQEKLHFTNCFPGKLCTSDLNIRSTFNHPIHVKHINFTYPGLRFEDKIRTGSKIAPQTVTSIGRIYFQPSALCGSHCYIQQTDESSVFNNLHNILNLSSDLPDFDELELSRRIELYRDFKKYFGFIDFILATKEMQNIQLNLMIEVEWPRLVSGRHIQLSGEVNKYHTHDVEIVNPSDETILIDYNLSQSLNSITRGFQLPLEVATIFTRNCYITDQPAFSLINAPLKKPILIPGHSSITIPIKFQADNAGEKCTLLNIRNNLTLYEGIWITAKALQTQFRLGNRKPGSQTPLLFEITEEHLTSACPVNSNILNYHATEHTVQPQVILRRVFTARNSGELPLKIDSFWIGNQPCKGYGFQVTDCSSFELKPNSSKKIEISYQTDFTATRVSRPLTLKTNLTYEVNFILVAQLPSNGLRHCIGLLPRPPWEHKIRTAAIIMLLITFILVIIAVHIDYGNIIYNQSLLYQAREKGTVHPTFNLRNIAMRSTRQNNDESSLPSNECNNRGGKTKLSTAEKYENTSSTLSLKRRIVKNSKTANSSEAKSVSISSRTTMSLADMVSWTFGSKNSKKSGTNSNKSLKASWDQTNDNAAAVTPATNSDLKTMVKPKVTEKSLIDKMDSDLKKTLTYKKVVKSTNEKVNNKIMDKTEEDVVKRKADESTIQNKEMKKDKSSPKLNGKSNVSLKNCIDSNTSGGKTTKEHRKSLDFTSQDIYCQSNASATTTTPGKNQYSPKEISTNGRKVGKTPGRERRKQSAQSSSPTTSDITSSCSSSTSSSCSSNHNAAKRNERKSKAKASSSLKFNHNTNNASNMFPSVSSSSSSPTSLTSNGRKTESAKSHLDILSPWECNSQITFSDVLQKPQPQSHANGKQLETLTSDNDRIPQELLFSDKTHTNGLENSEIVAALTPKRPKNPVMDLGPIGSRKSPSSTPVWEPVQSAITMQLPRPINTTPTTANTSSSSSSAATFYPMNSNFGYNDITKSLTTQMPSALQQQQDIQTQLYVLQRQLLEQQRLQQQQQQFLNSNTLNNNWSSSLWGPIQNNSSATSHGNNSTIFINQANSMLNSTWSLTTPTTSSSSTAGVVVRPPPGLEQNFSLTTGMNVNDHQTLAAASSAATSSITSTSASTNLSSTFTNNTMATSSTNDNNNDNMPMFNLFGGLSSIWNDNWKQSTTTNQQQQQKTQQQPSSSNQPLN